MYYSGGNLEAFARPLAVPGAEKKHFYIIGSGLAGLSAACFLIRDAGADGSGIHILEKNPIAGGALDGYEFEENGFVSRGNRILDPHDECLWDLLRSVPSPGEKDASVLDEIWWLSRRDPNYSICPVTEKCGQDARLEGHFDLSDAESAAVIRFLVTPDQELGGRKISEALPHDLFFTNFWLYIQTLYGFSPDHGALELKRKLKRILHLLGDMPSFRGALFGRYNEYESIIRPLINYLEAHGVQFEYEISVTNVAFDTALRKKRATRIDYVRFGEEDCIDLTPDDMVFITPGGMTENSTMGSQYKPAPFNTELRAGGGWELWRRIAEQDKSFGNPDVFCSAPEQTARMSATLTTSDSRVISYIKRICKRDTFSGKVVSGGPVMCRDSGWGMSWSVGRQPYFENQKPGTVVIWITARYCDRPGNYEGRSMRDCQGREICAEWLYQIGVPVDEIEELADKGVSSVPVMMPYAFSPLMPREDGDRPAVVPEGAVNFAFIGQFAETAGDAAMTCEYAVRTAMEAVYGLLGTDRGIPEVWNGPYDLRTVLKAAVELRDGRALTGLDSGFRDRRLTARLLKKLQGTDLETLLSDSGAVL